MKIKIGDKVKLVEGKWITGDGSKFVYPPAQTVTGIYEVKTVTIKPFRRILTKGYDANGLYMTSDTPEHQLELVTA